MSLKVGGRLKGSPAPRLAPGGPRPISRWRQLALLTVWVALLIAAWHATVVGLDIPSFILPTPTDVFSTFVERFSILVDGARITVFEALTGFGLAALVGVLLAVIVVMSPYMRTVVMPSLVAVNATPKVAVAPILIIWLGLGVSSKIALAFLLSFFPIVINTARGLADIDSSMIDYFRLLKSSRSQTFFKGRLPHSLPAMFDGFKIALPISMIGAVIGEFVASREGIGHQIIIAYSSFDTEMVFAAVITIAVISTMLFQVLVWGEKKILKWRPPDSA
jgi:NitT/TauT family transport system permease protein